MSLCAGVGLEGPGLLARCGGPEAKARLRRRPRPARLRASLEFHVDVPWSDGPGATGVQTASAGRPRRPLAGLMALVPPTLLTRRNLLRYGLLGTLALAGSAVGLALVPGRSGGPQQSLRVLGPREYATLEALATRMLPLPRASPPRQVRVAERLLAMSDPRTAALKTVLAIVETGCSVRSSRGLRPFTRRSGAGRTMLERTQPLRLPTAGLPGPAGRDHELLLVGIRDMGDIGCPGPQVGGVRCPRWSNTAGGSSTGSDLVEDEQLSCDVCVVGSGAGGGVLAQGLVEAGLDVIMVEAGGYRARTSTSRRPAPTRCSTRTAAGAARRRRHHGAPGKSVGG